MKNPGNVIEGAMPMPMSSAIRHTKHADGGSGRRRARRPAARYVVTTPGERAG
ncbi:hypothetical protein ACFQ3P_30350 [Paraburkholderia sabiae]|uniref:hypothetical protein n=1 Tax=Paraburkholderia sabiae TaxID=273251 RepID=UPI001CC3557C|nr:hypothetical protein [Paraburkholderia sabiae]WJZ74936.1 hypothetical protein QEN71_03730 [Paraburkholderia sabiae]